MGRPRLDISGQRFGKFLVSDNTIIKGNSVLWECKCDCGEICFIESTDLTRGRKNFCKNCNDLKSKESAFSIVYETYKRGAIQRNYSFSLDKEIFKKMITSNCNYCGIEPNQIYYKKGMVYGIKYNGIDRINNKLGYELDNCVPACKFCNFAKSKGTLEEFNDWINRLKNI